MFCTNCRSNTQIGKGTRTRQHHQRQSAAAQYSSKEPAQKDQAAQASLKSIDGTVKVDGDKITFVADKDQKSWAVENPEALKGHEGHRVQVKAHVDADTGSIHIMEVKMLKGSETKKEEMKK